MDGARIVTANIRLGQVLRFGEAEFQVQSPNYENEPSSENETESGQPPNEEPRTDLSEGQRRVFELLGNALSEKEIALELQLSSSTVHKHIHAIYRAFEVHSRTELLVKLNQPRNRK